MVDNQQDDNRLIRIETKIDQLSDAFVALARAEERMIAADRDRDAIMNRLEKIEIKMQDFSDKLNNASGTTFVIGKFFWLIVAAVVGALALQFFG